MLLLSVFAGAVSLLTLGGLQRQLRGARFARVEREFVARWSRLSPSRKVGAVARAYGMKNPMQRLWLRGQKTSGQLDGMMFQALDERWQTMRATRDYDFVKLREDLAELLPYAG